RLQLPCAFIKDLAVEDLDDAGGGGISHLNFILGGDTPKTGFADIRFTGCAFGVNLPRARAKGEVFATIVGNDSLLAKVKWLAFRIVCLAFTLPYAHEWQQA